MIHLWVCLATESTEFFENVAQSLGDLCDKVFPIVFPSPAKIYQFLYPMRA